jgi:hypothetical protein
VKKLGLIAVRCRARLTMVLYGHTRSLYGILPCLTAGSRIILRVPNKTIVDIANRSAHIQV